MHYCSMDLNATPSDLQLQLQIEIEKRRRAEAEATKAASEATKAASDATKAASEATTAASDANSVTAIIDNLKANPKLDERSKSIILATIAASSPSALASTPLPVPATGKI